MFFLFVFFIFFCKKKTGIYFLFPAVSFLIFFTCIVHITRVFAKQNWGGRAVGAATASPPSSNFSFCHFQKSIF